jgi:hypothetical protein
MKEQLISFETAKLAKEKGFNEGCLYDYNNSSDLRKNVHSLFYNDSLDFYIAPTQSLLQKWLREVHNIDVEASLVYRLNTREYLIRLYKNNTKIILSTFYYYKTYEEALEEGLYQALLLI